MATKIIDVKEYKELEENSYRYHRMMTKLCHHRLHDNETDFENTCLEIGKLQGFREGIQAAMLLLKP